MLNEDFHLRDSGCSNSVDALEEPRHRWYPIKEAFSPRLVEAAIGDISPISDAFVFDPFCGSGTVPLTSSAIGHKSVGIEVNPFLAFVSRTKLLSPSVSMFDSACPQVMEGIKKGKSSPLERYSTFSSSGGSQKWLFNQVVLRSFEGGWAAIDDCESQVRDLLRMALIASAMDTCNAVRDGKCLRYRKEWQEYGFGKRDFTTAFEGRILKMSEDLKKSSIDDSKWSVTQGDSRTHLTELRSAGFRLCVTSPPYLNSFDYSDIYRPEMFLGKFVTSSYDLRALRFKTLRSHVQVEWADPVVDSFGALYKACASRIRDRQSQLWNPRIPLMIQAYFEDMSHIFRRLHKVAAAESSLWVVVATSAYAGVEIPVDLILAEIGSREGWFLREVGVLRYLRTAGQHWKRWSGLEDEKPRLRESVIIFDKQRPKRSASQYFARSSSATPP